MLYIRADECLKGLNKCCYVYLLFLLLDPQNMWNYKLNIVQEPNLYTDLSDLSTVVLHALAYRFTIL